MRLLLSALIAFWTPLAQAAEPSFDALSHLLHAYAGPIDEKAAEAAPEAEVPPESGARLAKIQSDLSLLAEGFEAFRHPSHAERALGDLPDHISPELRPFFKNRASTLDAVYRTLAVTDYTWALRFPDPNCDPRSRRKSLLAARDGLFIDPLSGDLSPWLSRLLGPSAGGRTAEEALDRASGRQVLSARDYELVRVKVAKITEALTSEKAVGAERARLYCLRAEAYETMASAQQAAQEGPIQAARGSAAEGAPDREASSVLLLAFVEGPNRFRAVGAGVMVETPQGPRVLTDARLMLAGGEAKPSLYGFARAKDGTLEKPRLFVVERADASGVMVGRLEDGEGIPALKIAQGPAARRDFYRAIGHMGASGAWTVSQGLVTESGDGTFASDAILGPDMLGSPLLNDAGEVVGLVVLSPGAGAPVAVHVEHLRRVADGDLPAAKDLPFVAARQTGSGSLLTTATPFVGELSVPGSGAIEARRVSWDSGGGVGDWRPKSSAGPPSGYSRSQSSPSSSYGSGKSAGTVLGEALGSLVVELIFKGIPALGRGIEKLFKSKADSSKATAHAAVIAAPHVALRPALPPPPPPKPICELKRRAVPASAGAEPFEVSVQFSCDDAAVPLGGHRVKFTFQWDGKASTQTATIVTDARGVATLVMQVSNEETKVHRIRSTSERSHDELDNYDPDKRSPGEPAEAYEPGAAEKALMTTAATTGSSRAAAAGRILTLGGRGATLRVTAVIMLGPVGTAVVVAAAGKQVFDIGWAVGSVAERRISDIQRGLKQYDKEDCEEARRWQLDNAGISKREEHKFKSDWQAEPNSEYDICACKDGRIVIKRRKMCGMPGGVIPTDRRWK